MLMWDWKNCALWKYIFSVAAQADVKLCGAEGRILCCSSILQMSKLRSVGSDTKATGVLILLCFRYFL